MSDSRQQSCPCAKRFPEGQERIEDGTFVYYPHQIGNTILICGKRSSRFPHQLHVGADWPCMAVTYVMMIVPTVIFVVNVATIWGPAVIVITVFTALIMLIAFSATACTDPGIVYKHTDAVSDANKAVQMIECGQCHVDRPLNSTHCYECKVCVEGLDHHCPWTGKCIGKKNLFCFHFFLWALGFHVMMVIATCIYSLAMGKWIFGNSSRPP